MGPLRRRKRITLAVGALAVLLALGGLIASATIKSPAQLAAATKPPAPTLLTAPVRRTVVSQTVLAQGVVGEPSEITGLPGFNAGAVAGSGEDEQAIVTRIFIRPGGPVDAGVPILEVAGRPLFALPGTVPAYRNLSPGESGADVAQLQAGLEYLGFSVGADTAGTFGRGTAAAVSAFYHLIGYPVPQATGPVKADRGPMVPVDEVMFVPRLPAHLVKISAPVGGLASASLITLALGNPVIAGQFPPADAGLLRPGMHVTISSSLLGLTEKGTLKWLSRNVSISSSVGGGAYLPARIAPAGALRIGLIGQDVQVTVTAARSAGAVLAVPTAAVFAAANGNTYVTRVTAGGAQITVPVRIGVTGDGLVQVMPVRPAALSAGDAVVVGENYTGSSAGPSGSSGVG